MANNCLPESFLRSDCRSMAVNGWVISVRWGEPDTGFVTKAQMLAVNIAAGCDDRQLCRCYTALTLDMRCLKTKFNI